MTSESWVETLFAVLRLQQELRGEICLPLSTITKQKKETCVSRSFSKPITCLEELRQAISTHVVRASEKLRQQRQLASAITVFTRTSPFISSFYSQSATTKLDLPSNTTTDLLAVSLILTERIFKPNRPLIKAGVIMQNLQSNDYLQQHLLIAQNKSRETKGCREKLMRTIDELNHRYGSGTITWASCGLNKSQKSHSKQLSRAATTRINEIPIAKA